MKVLHYKSNFLNPSETFILRILTNHQAFKPVGMCINRRQYTENLEVFEKPQQGLGYLTNTVCFHLNWCLPFYKKVIAKERPEVIHAHFGFDGYRMMKPAEALNVPLVVSFYGSDVSRLPGEFDWERRYRKLAKKGDAFIAATHHMKRQLIRLGFPKTKIKVIPFGLELDKFTFNSNKVDSRKLMMVGRMVEKKGFRFAIDAVNHLHKKGINVTLDLYGDGVLREALQRKVKQQSLECKIKFHGHVPIERILQEHQQHNVLLAPSLTAPDGDMEGLPNTILEAMAVGTQVITTDHAAISEVIKNHENGLIVEAQNARALAQAIEKALLVDCNIKEMKRNARKTIEEHFEIEDVVSQIETLYQNVIHSYD